jgi:hypothetical protein
MENKLVMRSHNFADIMGKLEVDEFTQNDLDRVWELESERDTLVNKNGRAVKWTETKQTELDKLLYKKDSKPELSKGAKTAIEKIFKETILNCNRMPLETLPIMKGLECEDLAIERLSRFIGVKLVKNMRVYKDEFGEGIPDCLIKGKVGFDTKVSFTYESFPMFEDKLETAYYWQNVRYMMLTGVKEWYTVYSLENHPENVIKKLARQMWYKAGNEGEVSESFIKEIRDYYNYDHLHDEQRLRFFKVELKDEDVQKVKKHYELANQYYNSLFEKNKKLNSLKIEI